MPIPENSNVRFHHGCKRSFRDVLPALEQFTDRHKQDLYADLKFPRGLHDRAMHLDPDFEHLTYGDDGDRRGANIAKLTRGDLLVFYAGLRSIRPRDRKLVYAIVGLFVVEEVLHVAEIPQDRWHENAHTRKSKHARSDIVVRARRDQSGRLERCLPIGEYRHGAYRVRRDVLRAWGHLGVKDGFIQRSGRPPRFLKPERFWSWFRSQHPRLLQTNNPVGATSTVIIVHLRQPNRSDPKERRSDPFWEYGSFGCTGCHHRNLLNPKRIHELTGVRLAFAQGGPSGFKLVLLTPPIDVIQHSNCCEVRWPYEKMPFRYVTAPLLVNNEVETDFPALLPLLTDGQRPTWMAQFSSNFRSRRKPLEDDVARCLVKVYDRKVRDADGSAFSQSYVDALPYPPRMEDGDRLRTYKRLIAQADGRSEGSKRCGSRSGTTSNCSSKRRASRSGGKRRGKTLQPEPFVPDRKGIMERCRRSCE